MRAFTLRGKSTQTPASPRPTRPGPIPRNALPSQYRPTRPGKVYCSPPNMASTILDATAKGGTL